MHIFNVLLYVTVQHEPLNAKLNPYIYPIHNSNMVSNRLIQINNCYFFFNQGYTRNKLIAAFKKF